MNIIIKDRTFVAAELSLSDLSYDINLHLENVLRELIKSANFQDIVDRENEDIFYVMLFMQKSLKVLDGHFQVPFKVVDYFISNTKGEKLGTYAPFYYRGSVDKTHYVFTLAYGSLALIIEVKYEFIAEDKEICLCPLEECIEYFSDYTFKAQVKYITHLPADFSSHMDNRHKVSINFNNKIGLLSNLISRLNKAAENGFKTFKLKDPDWLVANINDYGYLNLIISDRYRFIDEAINSVFITVFNIKESDITIRVHRLSLKHITPDGISLPFVVAVDSSFEFKCLLKLSYSNSQKQACYLRGKGLIDYWKQVSRSIKVTINIEGCMLYDPLTHFFGD